NYKNNLTFSVQNTPIAMSGTGNFNDTMLQFEGGYNAFVFPVYDVNNDMRLKNTSIGVGAGTDSRDIGLFGRGFKFSIEGNAVGVVDVQHFSVENPVLKRGEQLKIKIKAD